MLWWPGEEGTAGLITAARHILVFLVYTKKYYMLVSAPLWRIYFLGSRIE